MGYSRKGAIDLSQKEAAVSGLFFNESNPGEGERKSKKERSPSSPRWKNGIFPWKNGILSAPRGVPAVIRASVTLR